MKVTGIDELLDRLDRKLKVHKVVADYTHILRGKAVKRAPVDTGYLKGSITSEVESLGDNGARGTVTAKANYSGFVEYGTRYMKAQPYMKPSLNEVYPKFREAVKEAAEDGN